MNYEQTYKEISRLILQYRSELENVWPTPTVEDSLKFAITEAAEVIDAELRQNPTYARNNNKSIDPLDEVADCLMMLCTATRGEMIPLHSHPLDDRHLLLINYCSDAAYHHHTGIQWKVCADCAILICLELLGDEAPARVESRLERIKAKLLR